MQIGSIVKYYGCIGIVTEIVDAVRFPNNTPCKEACIFFASGCYIGMEQTLFTHANQLEVVCK